MKAHRRNGIPTLMLQTGGSTGPSSRFGRLFQESDIEKQRQRERAAAQRAGLRSVLAGLPSLFDPLEKGTYDAVMAATKPIQGFQRQGTPFPGQRTQGLTALNAESYSKALGDSFVNLGQFFDELKRQGKFAAALSPGETEAATASRKRAQEVVADLRAKIGGELNRANPIAELVDEFGGEGSLEADILRQAQASSQAAEVSRQEQEGIAPQPLTQAQRAADALSGGVLRPQTTSAPAAAGAARQEQEGLAGTAALELPRLPLELPRLLLELRRLLLRLLPLKSQKQRLFVRRRVRRPKPKKLLRLPIKMALPPPPPTQLLLHQFNRRSATLWVVKRLSLMKGSVFRSLKRNLALAFPTWRKQRRAWHLRSP
jgi:hypothetical protein